MRSTLLVLCAALTAAACSSSSSGGDSTTDSGTDAGAADAPASDGSEAHDSAAPDSSDSSANDASEAGGACNTIANVAQSITIQQVAEDPPMAQGGTFVDGTYAMTDVTIYTGPQGPAGPSGSAQTTVQISGTTFQVVTSGTPATRTVSTVVSGTSVTAMDTCPDSTMFHETFTTTSSGFVVYLDGGTDDAGARTVAETFTKQ